MELRLANEAELTEAYRRDLEPSFPAAELPPLHAMLKLVKKGEYRPWCLFDGEQLLGEAFVYAPAETPDFVLFDYLCVSAQRRSGGLGARMIGLLREKEHGAVLYGEAEIPAYAPDRALAERRLAFYERCGLRRAGYDACVFGVPYHTLYLADAAPADDALCAAHLTAWRKRLPKLICRRYVTIPWDASMGPPKKVSWLE